MTPTEHFWTVVISASATAAAIFLAQFSWTLFLFFGLVGVGLSAAYWNKEVGKWMFIFLPGAAGLFCFEGGGPAGWFLAFLCFLGQYNTIQNELKA